MDARITKNRVPAVRRSLTTMVDEAVRKAAFDLQGRAQQLAPVDTSSLRNSIHTITDKDDGYGAAVAAARAVNPDVEIAPRVGVDGPHEAVVAVAAAHGAPVEFGSERETAHGTVSRAPHPFLIPAAEEQRKAFPAAVAAAVRKAGRDA